MARGEGETFPARLFLEAFDLALLGLSSIADLASLAGRAESRVSSNLLPGLDFSAFSSGSRVLSGLDGWALAGLDGWALAGLDGAFEPGCVLAGLDGAFDPGWVLAGLDGFSEFG